MSDRNKLDWTELILVETPNVIHAPEDPLCDIDGFIALPAIEPAPVRATRWLQWGGLGGGVVGEA